MCDGPCITARDLRLDATETGAPETLDAARCQGERAAIERALQRNGHRLAATARELGISRVTLYRLMARHGLRGDEMLGGGRSEVQTSELQSLMRRSYAVFCLKKK